MNGKTIHYRFNRGDLQSMVEVLMEEVYKCTFPVHPRTILDLGANIGLTSLWMSQEFRPEVIMGVEPEPGNAKVASLNYQSNSLNGEVIKAAVGPSDGEAWFAVRNESNLGQLSKGGGPDTVRVPVVGIHTLLDRFSGGRVDLVKMDIEGGEAPLLSGDGRWLQHVGSLMIEWHDVIADSRPLIQFLENAGFKHRRINSDRQGNLSAFSR